jgi:hypothetical protein
MATLHIEHPIKSFLETTVWASAEASPALAGNAHGEGAYRREPRRVATKGPVRGREGNGPRMAACPPTVRRPT